MGFQMPDEIDSLHAGSGREALSNHRHSNEIFLGKGTIGFQNEFDGLAEVRARLIKCLALGISHPAKHGSQFE